MPKQFKAEKINYASKQSLLEREQTLKAKSYIESLAKNLAEDRKNMRRIMKSSDVQTYSPLFAKLLHNSAEAHLQNSELKELIISNSSLFTKYLISRLKLELGPASEDKQRRTIWTVPMATSESFKPRDVLKVSVYLKSTDIIV